jgi:DNA helicase IV
MKYIERVLPSLGETGVVMASLGRLMPGITAVAEPDSAVAAIKGRLDMAEVVANAVANRQRIPAGNRILEVDGRKLVLTPRQVRRAKERARATGKPHNEARVSFVKILLRELTEQMTELVEAGNIGNNADRSYLAEDVRSARDVRIALNLCWMPMTPEKLVGELLSKPAILEACTPNLSPEQRALLLRPAGSPWTESDVPLLDEAAELLGELDAAAGRGLAQQEQDRARDLANAKQTLVNMETAGVDVLVTAEDLVDQNQERETRLTAAERATTDRSWAFGHIVVDEAQELSPMQWRLLVRRCPLKSFTIVGDIAQTSSVAGANSWHSALGPMFGDRWQLEELTVNYRTPSQIAEAAARMATAAGLVVSAPKAVREGRWSPIIDTVGKGQIVNKLVEVLPEELDAIEGGLMAVIADGDLLPEASAALRAVYGHRVGTGAGSYAQDIVVISPREAKGLEFDGVVVLEPMDMLNHEHGRVGDLYVAMTRPTQRLRLIAAAGIPAGIEE